MEKLLNIIDLILAIELWVHEIHLTAKDYSLHLLADRLSQDFDTHKDAIIQETAIQTYQEAETISNSTRNLSGALSILKEIPRDFPLSKEEYLEYAKQLYTELLEQASSLDTETALRKELDDLCAKLSRDLYLINQNLKGA